jgi:hypothetical protein
LHPGSLEPDYKIMVADQNDPANSVAPETIALLEWLAETSSELQRFNACITEMRLRPAWEPVPLFLPPTPPPGLLSGPANITRQQEIPEAVNHAEA